MGGCTLSCLDVSRVEVCGLSTTLTLFHTCENTSAQLGDGYIHIMTLVDVLQRQKQHRSVTNDNDNPN